MGDSEDDSKGFTQLFDFDLLGLVFCQVNSLSRACLLGEAKCENFVEVGQVQVFFLKDVEEEARREVCEHHQVADRLHDIPTVQMESSIGDEGELTNGNAAAQGNQTLGLERSASLDLIQLIFCDRDFTF